MSAIGVKGPLKSLDRRHLKSRKGNALVHAANISASPERELHHSLMHLLYMPDISLHALLSQQGSFESRFVLHIWYIRKFAKTTSDRKFLVTIYYLSVFLRRRNLTPTDSGKLNLRTLLFLGENRAETLDMKTNSHKYMHTWALVF